MLDYSNMNLLTWSSVGDTPEKTLDEEILEFVTRSGRLVKSITVTKWEKRVYMSIPRAAIIILEPES